MTCLGETAPDLLPCGNLGLGRDVFKPDGRWTRTTVDGRSIRPLVHMDGGMMYTKFSSI